jgi:diguanylate cyclase (GGDEF)-like protein
MPGKRNKIYIEPVIRTLIGMLILIGILIDYFYAKNIYFIIIAAFIGLNLFQSGFTGFCGLEKILKKVFSIESELDVIRELGEQIGQARADQEHIKTLNLLEDAIIELDCKERIVKVSDGFGKIINCTNCMDPTCMDCKCNHKCYGKSFSEFVSEEDREDVIKKFSELHDKNGIPLFLQFRIRSYNGREKIVEGKFIHQTSEDGDISGIKGILRDKTETILQERQILHMNLHDSLTGLPNRILMTDRLEQAINISRRSKSSLALMMIDIDSLRNINEKLGHHMGDTYLVSIAEIFSDDIRSMDTLSRWGSDEFVLLLTNFKTSDDIKKIISGYFYRTVEKTIKRFPDVDVSFRAGVSIFPDDAFSFKQLIAYAGRALDKAKSRSKNNFSFYSEISGEGLRKMNEAGIAWKLQSSIENDLIRVHYQPIVDAKTHKVVSVEALARWHDDEYGWVNPSMFIQVAENLGFMNSLGRKIFETAFEHYLNSSEYKNDISLSLNISPAQLIVSNFANDFIIMLERYGIRPESITLEITEGVGMLGMGRARECLNLLSKFGCRISLDDFGCGYSSISTLQDLPINEFKIDGVFTRRVHEKDGKLILKSLIDMGHAMELKIVCECVEDLNTAELLKDLGTDCLQGNFYMSPQADFFKPDVRHITTNHY